MPKQSVNNLPQPVIVVTSIRLTPDLDSVRAFCTVEMDFGAGIRITFYGLKLVESKKKAGDFFIGMPQRKGDNDKWYSHYFFSPALKDSITSIIRQRYEQEEG